MKRHILLKTTYCDGIYTVKIGTDIGEFTGEVFCRIEDRDHQSDYFGWELAEIKAEIQYARAKKKFYEAQLKSITEFWHEMAETRNYDPDAFWVIQMRKKVNKIYDAKELWVNRITALKTNYYAKVLSMDAFAKKRKEKGI